MGKSKEDEGILRLAVRSKIKKMFEVKKYVIYLDNPYCDLIETLNTTFSN